MFRYKDQNSNLKAHIKTLQWVAGFQMLAIAALWHGWEKAREDIRIHIPPDIRSGATVVANRVGPADAFVFGTYIFQQLNRWPEDGQKEFGKRVFQLSAYLTPQFQEWLIKDIEERGHRGELSGRTRALQLLAGAGYKEQLVQIPAKDVWIVQLDVHIVETVRGMDVKSVYIRYPLRVVKYAVDPESNPWGLALDGYDGDGPRRLSEAEMKGENP